MSLDSITSSSDRLMTSAIIELVGGKRPGTGREVCDKWMPRKRASCARRPGHKGDCRTAEALADSRARQTARRKGVRLRDNPEARRNRFDFNTLIGYRAISSEPDKVAQVGHIKSGAIQLKVNGVVKQEADLS